MIFNCQVIKVHVVNGDVIMKYVGAYGGVNSVCLCILLKSLSPLSQYCTKLRRKYDEVVVYTILVLFLSCVQICTCAVWAVSCH